MTFAEKMKDLREAAGLTQQSLAEASGIPVWTIRNYEQGRREPNWKGVLRIASALGVAAETFSGCEDVVETEVKPSAPANKKTRPGRHPKAQASGKAKPKKPRGQKGQ